MRRRPHSPQRGRGRQTSARGGSGSCGTRRRPRDRRPAASRRAPPRTRRAPEQPEPAAHPVDVGVHRDLRPVEGEDQDAGGGLAPDSGERVRNSTAWSRGASAIQSRSGWSWSSRRTAWMPGPLRVGEPSGADRLDHLGRSARRGPPPRWETGREAGRRRRRGSCRRCSGRGRSGRARRSDGRAARSRGGRRARATGRGSRARGASQAASSRSAHGPRIWSGAYVDAGSGLSRSKHYGYNLAESARGPTRPQRRQKAAKWLERPVAPDRPVLRCLQRVPGRARDRRRASVDGARERPPRHPPGAARSARSSSPAFQQAFLAHQWVIDLANWMYFNSHFVITTAFLVWLYLYRQRPLQLRPQHVPGRDGPGADRLRAVPDRAAADVPGRRLHRHDRRLHQHEPGLVVHRASWSTRTRRCRACTSPSR